MAQACMRNAIACAAASPGAHTAPPVPTHTRVAAPPAPLPRSPNAHDLPQLDEGGAQPLQVVHSIPRQRRLRARKAAGSAGARISVGFVGPRQPAARAARLAAPLAAASEARGADSAPAPSPAVSPEDAGMLQAQPQSPGLAGSRGSRRRRRLPT